MYLLNLFWFSKILWGLMKGFGINDAVNETERVLEYETDDETDETDDDTKK